VNQSVVKLANKLLLPLLDDPYLSHYRSIDEIDTAYARATNGVALLLDRALKWKASKSPADKAEAIAGYRAYQEALPTLRDARTVVENVLLQSSVTIESGTWSIRLPSDEKLAKVLKSFSRTFAQRDSRLLSSGSISLAEHSEMLAEFQDFVLLMALYRESPSSGIKSDAKQAFARAYAIYRTPVKIAIAIPESVPVQQPAADAPIDTPVVPTTPEPAKTLGDMVTLPESAAFGQSNEGIRILQSVLKAYGYFPADTPTTGYYGGVTRDSLSRFSASILGIDNPDGLYTQYVRDAMRALPYDPTKFTN